MRVLTSPLRRLTALHVVDSLAGTDPEPILTTMDAAKESFVNSLSSRVIGLLIGNVLAGFVFRYIADFVNSKREEFDRRQTKPYISGESVSSPAERKISISGEAWLQLLFCLALDFGGDLSFTLPGFGEVEDIAWAPLSAYLLRQILGSNSVASLDFIKEILPGTDLIPVASIAWLLQNLYPESFLTRLLGLDAKATKVEQ